MTILVLYHHRGSYPLRATISEHLFSFRRHSGAPCAYVNLGMRGLPDLDRLRPDLIVLHTSLLSAARWDPSLHERTAAALEQVAAVDAIRVALPQDEFYATDRLCELLRRGRVHHVFSVAPPSEWPKIYSGLDHGTGMDEVLTGYVEDATVARLGRFVTAVPRPIDVGYRAWHASMWLGRHGQLKTQVADRFGRSARRAGLRADISTREGDTFLGDDWYRFLGRCRWMLGVEGGASILDHDGSLRARTDAFVLAHPEADFETVEAHCFPGRDGELALFAISPRQLEAVMTRSGQILVEGRYNGLLEPERHYLPLRRDFSNVDEVAERARDERLRAEMVARAYDEIVAPGRASYRTLVELVLDRAAAHRRASPEVARLGARLATVRAGLDDAVDWTRIAASEYGRRHDVEGRIKRALRLPALDRGILVQRLLDAMPTPVSSRLRRARRWWIDGRGGD